MIANRTNLESSPSRRMQRLSRPLSRSLSSLKLWDSSRKNENDESSNNNRERERAPSLLRRLSRRWGKKNNRHRRRDFDVEYEGDDGGYDESALEDAIAFFTSAATTKTGEQSDTASVAQQLQQHQEVLRKSFQGARRNGESAEVQRLRKSFQLRRKKKNAEQDEKEDKSTVKEYDEDCDDESDRHQDDEEDDDEEDHDDDEEEDEEDKLLMAVMMELRRF